jgi:hypothetical protein
VILDEITETHKQETILRRNSFIDMRTPYTVWSQRRDQTSRSRSVAQSAKEEKVQIKVAGRYLWHLEAESQCTRLWDAVKFYITCAICGVSYWMSVLPCSIGLVPIEGSCRGDGEPPR